MRYLLILSVFLLVGCEPFIPPLKPGEIVTHRATQTKGVVLRCSVENSMINPYSFLDACEVGIGSNTIWWSVLEIEELQ